MLGSTDSHTKSLAPSRIDTHRGEEKSVQASVVGGVDEAEITCRNNPRVSTAGLAVT